MEVEKEEREDKVGRGERVVTEDKELAGKAGVASSRARPRATQLSRRGLCCV